LLLLWNFFSFFQRRKKINEAPGDVQTLAPSPWALEAKVRPWRGPENHSTSTSGRLSNASLKTFLLVSSPFVFLYENKKERENRKLIHNKIPGSSTYLQNWDLFFYSSGSCIRFILFSY